MKKVSNVLNMYISIFWIVALLLTLHAGSNLNHPGEISLVFIIAVILFVIGYIGVLAMPKLREMEEKEWEK